MTDRVVTVTDLATYFYLANGVVKAVDGVDLTIDREEIVTIVGESGSGKSVTALSIMRLIQPPGRIVRGRIEFGGEDLVTASPRRIQALRGDRIGMIFQNPFSSLHPQFRIGEQMIEPLVVRQGLGEREARHRVIAMLERIAIERPEEVLRRYSFEVSAGICQRVMLAMALMSGPELLIADEPTTNLDALAQAQILDLIKELRSAFHMSVLLITHDFGVVSRMADRIVVMYAGRHAEVGNADDVLADPRHPYSVGLINSVPVPGQRRDRLQQIPGEVPDVMRLPPGCSFRARCAHAMTICEHDPEPVGLSERHSARCWLFAGDRAA